MSLSYPKNDCNMTDNKRVVRPYILLFIMALGLIATIISAGTSQVNYDKYKVDWKKVDSLEKAGLPRQALETAKKIYTKAHKADNQPQVVKALIHIMKYESYVIEDEYVKYFGDMETEISKSSGALKAILHSITAELYQGYYNQNYWAVSERIAVDDTAKYDVRGWDNSRFDKAIKDHYEASLAEPELLQKISIETFEDILITKEVILSQRPTLYCFLANRYLDYLTSNSRENFKNKKFEQESNNWFTQVHDFVKLSFPAGENYRAIQIYRDLIQYYLINNLKPALVNTDINRIAYVYANSVASARDSLYADALRNVFDSNTIPEAAMAGYLLAKHYSINGDDYDGSDAADAKNLKNKIAFETCKKVIAKFPESLGANNCEALMQTLTAPYLSANLENVYVPEKEDRFQLKFKNCTNVFFRIVQVNPDALLEVEAKYDHSKTLNFLAGLKPLKEWKQALPDDGLMHRHSSELILPALPIGFYVLMANTSGSFQTTAMPLFYASFQVSDLLYMTRNQPAGDFELKLFGRTSGNALPGATVKVFENVYNYNSRKYEKKLQKTLQTDERGEILYSGNENYRNFSLEITHGNDKLLSENNFYSYNNRDYERNSIQTTFFTDRMIYRPGQVVYYKGLMVNKDSKQRSSPMPNSKGEVVFYDANNQVITKQAFTTNEFSTFHGSFEIPQGLATGQYRISDGYGNRYIAVEEYKRPKFEVKIEEPKQEFQLNDSVTVKGNARALAGFAIDGAKVSYRVVRRTIFPDWYWWYRPYNDLRLNKSEEIAFGEINSNESGEFQITFKAIPDPAISETQEPTFNFAIEVSVTDETGETRSTEQNIRLGYQSLELSFSVGSELDLQSNPKFQVLTKTLNGENVSADVKVSLFKLKKNPQYIRKRLWGKSDLYLIPEPEYRQKFPHDMYKDENETNNLNIESTEWEISLKTLKGEVMKPDFLKKAPAGSYLLQATSKDKNGKTVTTKKQIKFYDSNQTNFAFNEEFWTAAPRQQFEPGNNAEIMVGSSAKVTVYIEVERKGEISERQEISLNNEQKKIVIPVEEGDRGNFTVNVYTVHQSRSFARNYHMVVPYTNKELELKLITWRDKLLPGSEETWKMNITPKLGEKKVAELLLAMYDASLDAFAPNYWSLALEPLYYSNRMWQSFAERLANPKQLIFHQNNRKFLKFYKNYSLNWFGFNQYGNYYRGEVLSDVSSRPRAAATGISTIALAEEQVAANEKDNSAGKGYFQNGAGGMKKSEKDKSKNDGDVFFGNADMEMSGEGQVETPARSNFAETAFFFPSLTTDVNGDVFFTFKMPESLTKWKLMGMGITKDLSHGYIEKEVITQKDLMVNTFSPRFMRAGDEIIFTAKVTNLTESELSGNAKLELSNALSGKNMDREINQNTTMQMIKIPAGQSVKLEWKLKIPVSGLDAMQYKVTASAGAHSDGEEMIIPVLSNRMLVTESLPLMVRGKQMKAYKFDPLAKAFESSTLTFERMTLEVTQNPAWYAIQALPYLIEYPHECAEQTFHRFYANAIASNIANSDPKIKNIFDLWRTIQPDALLSNLEKNEELKNVLLQESPWVREAKNESERKRRVAVLFDLNRMDGEKNSAFKKLKQMQAPNGGWPWFKGGPDDRYITQLIVAGLGKLRKLGIQYDAAPAMIREAVQYCDRRLMDDYRQLIKFKVDMKLQHIYQTQVQYFYARSFFNDIPVVTESKIAYDYYQGQAMQYWVQMSRYEQGMLALHFHRKQNPAMLAKIIASLKENAIQSEELGMYWKGMLSGGYYWYESPIETMALLIEAFTETSNDVAAVDEMKIWLLRNKQTNDWKTTRATADACYALLMKGTQTLSTDNNTKVEIGALKFDPDDDKNLKTEAGTGYFKTTINPDKITPEMSNISINKTGAGISWGAVYVQYFEDLNKIRHSGNGQLKVSKKLFVETKTEKGPVLVPIENEKGVKIGDRVISRIELSVDRPLEYVHLKDMRSSCFEPENVFSTYKYQQGLGYYESTRDAATHFFISYMPKGFYVFEYPVRVTHSGNFSNGIATLQCMYAPEFSSHSEGLKVKVN